MSKGKIVIIAVFVLAMALTLMLTACNSDEKMGWSTSFECDDLPTLKLIFGDEFVYPSGENISDIIVKCEPENSLNEYLDDGGKLIKHELIPALVKVEANDVFQNVKLQLIIVKNNSERTGWNKLPIDNMQKINVNGVELYQSVDKGSFVYEPKDGQSYYIGIKSDIGEGFNIEEFAYKYFSTLN